METSSSMARVCILLDLVVYMYIVQSRVIASKYYVSNQAVTRSEAAKNCTLATPKINYTPDGELVTLELDLDLEDQDKLWVGYTRDYQVFRYIGCVPEEAVKSHARFTINQDIGLCYSACSSTEYKYFGVKISAGASNSAECTCITDISERSVISCGIGPGGPEFAFGGKSTMAIYTLASPAPVFTHSYSSWNNNTTNCFSYYDPTNRMFKWVDCTEYHACLCTSSPTGSTGNVTTTSKQWKLAAEICLKSNRYMSRYQANITTDSLTSQWLSNIKTESISSKTGPVVSEHKRYGYLKLDNGVFKLKFNKGIAQFHALCSNGDKLPEAITVTSTGARSSSEDSRLDDPTDTNTKARSSNVGVYVGVSVAIILVAVASAVAIIIWKRRQRPADTKEKVDNSTGNLTYQPSHTIVDSHLNNTGNLDSLTEPNGSDSYQTLAVVGDGNGLYDSLTEANGSDSYQTIAVVGDRNGLYDSLTEHNGSDSYQTLARVGDGKIQ